MRLNNRFLFGQWIYKPGVEEVNINAWLINPLI